MKRIYIAGPMTGIPELNFPAFHAAAAQLRSQGIDAVNPAEINGGADELAACSGMDPFALKKHWVKCMRNDIAQLVTCEGIHMLPGWERSKGATLEHHIASALGLEVRQNKKTLRWRVKDVDGPRYKALGNSWAVPVVQWIGRRIDAQLRRLA